MVTFAQTAVPSRRAADAEEESPIALGQPWPAVTIICFPGASIMVPPEKRVIVTALPRWDDLSVAHTFPPYKGIIAS
jgi:hypothetical protein